MIDLKLTIPDYTWTVHFHFAVTCYHKELMMDELKDVECPVMYLKKAFDLISSCKMNQGLTYSNDELRESVVIVGLTTDASEFASTMSHEIRHLVDDIMTANRYYDKEDLAYLTGNITKKIYPYVHKLLCGDCRKKVENSYFCRKTQKYVS